MKIRITISVIIILIMAGCSLKGNNESNNIAGSQTDATGNELTIILRGIGNSGCTFDVKCRKTSGTPINDVTLTKINDSTYVTGSLANGLWNCRACSNCQNGCVQDVDVDGSKTVDYIDIECGQCPEEDTCL